MPKKSDDAQRAELLVQAGLSPQYVADVLGVAIESKTMISSRSLTKPDAELATKLRGLIDYAIDEAAWEIQWGAPNARIGLLKVLVSRGSQLLGAEGATKIDELREMFMGEMTETRRLETVEETDDTP